VNTVLGAGLGLAVGLAVALLLELADRRRTVAGDETRGDAG